MGKFNKLFHFLVHKPSEIIAYGFMKTATFIPDKPYLKVLYRLKMGKKLDLTNPRTFNEKLQWLKLYNRKPIYTNMVDKYEVKKLVAEMIGEEYVIPTYGVWDSFDEIDFEQLPDKFVLKTTDGGGGTNVVICTDKSKLDKAKARKALKLCKKSEIYQNFREWPYKDIKPRILAEKYLVDKEGHSVSDYKFSCYNGEAHDVMLCVDREIGDVKFYFFDRNWNLLRYNKRALTVSKDFSYPKPQNIDKMFELAGILSQGIPYLRVDMYNVDGQIYFGETTFFPDSGFDPNLLPETDLLFGSKINLNI